MAELSPDIHVSPDLCQEASLSTESESSSSGPTPSPASVCKRLDLLLDGLASSTSTSPSPSSLSLKSGTIDTDNSSEIGAEDGVDYTGKQPFSYGDEASNGYADEDKSLTSSDEQQLSFEMKAANGPTKPPKLGETKQSKCRDVTSDPIQDKINIHPDKKDFSAKIKRWGMQLRENKRKELRAKLERNRARERKHQRQKAAIEAYCFETGAVSGYQRIDGQKNTYVRKMETCRGILNPLPKFTAQSPLAKRKSAHEWQCYECPMAFSLTSNSMTSRSNVRLRSAPSSSSARSVPKQVLISVRMNQVISPDKSANRKTEGSRRETLHIGQGTENSNSIAMVGMITVFVFLVLFALVVVYREKAFSVLWGRFAGLGE